MSDDETLFISADLESRVDSDHLASGSMPRPSITSEPTEIDEFYGVRDGRPRPVDIYVADKVCLMIDDGTRIDGGLSAVATGKSGFSITITDVPSPDATAFAWRLSERAAERSVLVIVHLVTKVELIDGLDVSVLHDGSGTSMVSLSGIPGYLPVRG